MEDGRRHALHFVEDVFRDAYFYSITCGEVTSIDNHGWVRIPSFLSMDRVVESASAENLTLVMLNVVSERRYVRLSILQESHCLWGTWGL